MTRTMIAEDKFRAQEAAPSGIGADTSAMFETVLVGVDGTSTGRDAIALGEMLRAHGGRLILAHVVLAQHPTYRNFDSTPVGKSASELLERERAATGLNAELTGTFAPSVGSGLHQLAEDLDADLLVVGSSRRGAVGRLFRGDDTQESLSGAASAVAVAPPGYAERSRHISTIGVAYNGSPESDAALTVARVIADGQRAALRALSVAWPTTAAAWPAGQAPSGDAESAMTFEAFEREATERLRAVAGVDGRVAVGPPGDELVRFGDQVDLLVVGSRGHGPVRRMLFGGTSAYLARTARVPLLVVPRGSAAHHAQTSA